MQKIMTDNEARELIQLELDILGMTPSRLGRIAFFTGLKPFLKGKTKSITVESLNKVLNTISELKELQRAGTPFK